MGQGSWLQKFRLSATRASQGTVLSQDMSPVCTVWDARRDVDITDRRRQEAEAAAHPQDMVSCALYTSGSLWCQCRWCGLPQEHGAPCASALPIPSGNRTASSSWSRAPTKTTHSFHIVLTGGEVGGREGRGKGIAPSLLWSG